MNTVVGVIADMHTQASDPVQHRTAWSSPSTGYRSAQDPRIPVDLEHDGRPVGEVVHLERHRGALWAVCEVDALPLVRVRLTPDEAVDVASPMYYSAEHIGGGDDGLLLRSLALTTSPARVGAAPVTWLPGPLARRSAWLDSDGRRFSGHMRDLIARAGDEAHRHGRTSLLVHDTDPPQFTRLARGGHIDEATGDYIPAATRGGPVAYDEEGRPRTMWVRPCGSILSVR